MAAQAWSSKTEPLNRGKSFSSCLGPLISDSPRSTEQFSLRVSEHLVHTEHYHNLISKNAMTAQCSKANKRLLLITFSPTAAVFPLLPTPLTGQGQLIFQWGKHLLHKHYRLRFVARVCVQGQKWDWKHHEEEAWPFSHQPGWWSCRRLAVQHILPVPSLPALPAAASCLHLHPCPAGPIPSAFGFPALSQTTGPNKLPMWGNLHLTNWGTICEAQICEAQIPWR